MIAYVSSMRGRSIELRVRAHLAHLSLLALLLPACATPTHARRRPPVEAPPAPRATGPSAAYQQAMKLYAKLDLAGALALAPEDEAERVAAGGPTAGEAALVRAHVALAQLEFERAYTLLAGRTDKEAAPLLWRAAWFSDRLAETAQPAAVDARSRSLHDVVVNLRKASGRTSTTTRVEVEAVGARRVSVPGDRHFTFPCRFAGKDVRARVDLSSPISRAPDDLLASDARATVTFAADGHELRVTAPFEASRWTQGEIVLGADVARVLHVGLELPQPALKLDLDEPVAAPGSQTLALVWPLGERPVVAATVWTDRASPAIFGFFGRSSHDLRLRARWAQWHGITSKTTGLVTGVTLGDRAVQTPDVELGTDFLELEPGDVELAGAVSLSALRLRARELVIAEGGRVMRLR